MVLKCSLGYFVGSLATYVPHPGEVLSVFESDRKTEGGDGMRWDLVMLRPSRISLGITMENIWLPLFALTSILVRHSLFSRLATCPP